MKMYVFVIVTALIALGCTLPTMGCGEEFTSQPTDAGVGGDAAGGTGGHAGNTGGHAGTGGTTSSSGGGGTAGTGGNTGGTAGTGGDGGGGAPPCHDATTDEIANMLGQPCEDLFSSGCGTANPVPRSEFISVVVDQVPEKLEGYADPGTATFSDVPLGHPAFSAVESALWLELIPVTAAFHPDDATTTCFAQEVVNAMNALPSIYAMLLQCTSSQNISASSGAIQACSFTLYGTSSGNHMTQVVRITNNLAGDYTVPQATSALEAVRFRCEIPAGGPFTTYTLPLTAGAADFNAIDCYDQAGGSMELQIQIDPIAAGQARIGIDPTTLAIRGAGQVNNPTFTIQ